MEAGRAAAIIATELPDLVIGAAVRRVRLYTCTLAGAEYARSCLPKWWVQQQVPLDKLRLGRTSCILLRLMFELQVSIQVLAFRLELADTRIQIGSFMSKAGRILRAPGRF